MPELQSGEALEAAAKAVTPDYQEIAIQVARLKSYRVGLTTIKEFSAGQWTAKDPYLSKLGVIGERVDGPHEVVDFEIAYCAGNKKVAEFMGGLARFVDEIGGLGAKAVEEFKSCQGPLQTSLASGGSLVKMKYSLIPSMVNPRFPCFHLRFDRGTLSSLQQTCGPINADVK